MYTSELNVQAVGPKPEAKQIRQKHIPIIVMQPQSKSIVSVIYIRIQMKGVRNWKTVHISKINRFYKDNATSFYYTIT